MARLVIIEGESNSGKDAVVKFLEETHGQMQVCSYTERLIRDYETDGVQHYFVNSKRFDEIMETEHILAYTKIENKNSGVKGYRYCATVESLNGATLYILDPDGLVYLREHNPDVEVLVLHIYASEETRRRRAISRGDDMTKFEERTSNEREQFQRCRDNKEYDYLIDNDIDGHFDEVKAQVVEILKKHNFI